jgi:hypothetical protein
LAPLLNRYVPPPLAVRVTEIIEQEIGPLLVKPASGTFTSPVTVVVAEAEQPLVDTTVTE